MPRETPRVASSRPVNALPRRRGNRAILSDALIRLVMPSIRATRLKPPMGLRSDFALKSYIKTTVACIAVVLVAVLSANLGLHYLPTDLGFVVYASSVVVALGAATLAVASVLVLVRHRRGEDGARDLFLALNRSREAAAINATVPRSTPVRRWLVRRLLGHDLVVGDLVEIKSWAEIRVTLDERGCLEELPFMPEMLAMCGRRARVFRSMHRLFDYRKTRRMRHMGGAVLLVGTVCHGSSHGGCEAACHTIWKSAWLRRVEPSDDAAGAPRSFNPSDPVHDAAVLQFGTRPPRYACQLTQLNAASQPIGSWSPINFLRPLVSGNVAPAAFVVGWLTHLFNELQQRRQGVDFPAFSAAVSDPEPFEEVPLKAGDKVVVRSPAEIRATLNDQMLNRGLYFEPDMLKHCGQQHCVQAEVKTIIDIVTGQTLVMKTPAYVLRDVHFSGERQQFNAQYEPLFWRGVWLRRDGN